MPKAESRKNKREIVKKGMSRAAVTFRDLTNNKKKPSNPSEIVSTNPFAIKLQPTDGISSFSSLPVASTLPVCDEKRGEKRKADVSEEL